MSLRASANGMNPSSHASTSVFVNSAAAVGEGEIGGACLPGKVGDMIGARLVGALDIAALNPVNDAVAIISCQNLCILPLS